MSVVALGAHPDDVEFGCSGALTKYRLEEDCPVQILTLTKGELIAPKDIRMREAQQSAKILDVFLDVWDYSDGHLTITPELIERTRRRLEEVHAQTLFAPHPDDSHQDHRAVAQLAIACQDYVDELFFYEEPSTQQSFRPNYYVDITQFLDIKLEALACFKSLAEKPYLNPAIVRGLAQFRGYECKRHSKLMEAYTIYRKIN